MTTRISTLLYFCLFLSGFCTLIFIYCLLLSRFSFFYFYLFLSFTYFSSTFIYFCLASPILIQFLSIYICLFLSILPTISVYFLTSQCIFNYFHLFLSILTSFLLSFVYVCVFLSLTRERKAKKVVRNTKQDICAYVMSKAAGVSERAKVDL